MSRVKLNQIDGFFVRKRQTYANISIPSGQNFVILSVSNGETPSDVMVMYSDFFEGAICTNNSTIGVYSSYNPATFNLLTPKNMVWIRDSVTQNPILSNGHQIYGLLQVGTGSISGLPFNDDSNRVQISFVRQNSSGSALESCPIEDIQNKLINYLYTYRYNIANHLDVYNIDPIFYEYDKISESVVPGSSGISAGGHEELRQLIHFLEEGSGKGFSSSTYKEILPIGSIFPSSVIWYLDSGKSKKIIEQLIIWNGVVPIEITWNLYDIDGSSIIESAVDNISYINNIFECSRVRNYI